MERENLRGDAKGKDTSGSNRDLGIEIAEKIDVRAELPCSARLLAVEERHFRKSPPFPRHGNLM
jgi:hypothetical protein